MISVYYQMNIGLEIYKGVRDLIKVRKRRYIIAGLTLSRNVKINRYTILNIKEH